MGKIPIIQQQQENMWEDGEPLARYLKTKAKKIYKNYH